MFSYVVVKTANIVIWRYHFFYEIVIHVAVVDTEPL